MKSIYTERQKFNQPWVWLLLVGITLIPAVGIVQQVFLKRPFGSKPASDAGLFLFFFVCLALCAFFYFVRLETTIDEERITIKYFPLTTKTVKWSEVQEAAVIDYGYVGGWGIRLGTKFGTVYSTRGKKGLAIQLKCGKRFLIATQNEAALNDFLQTLT